MMIFETHAHYDDQAFDDDRETLLNRLGENGIGRVVNISYNVESIRRTIALTKEYAFVYGALGIHPCDTKGINDQDITWLSQQLRQDKIVAVGEIGLDYYWQEAEKENQKKWFACQLDLAAKERLPVVIHSRDAAKDTLDIIKAQKAGENGGVIHCFSYGKEMARKYLEMGFFLGIGGVVTFQNAKKLKEVVKFAPLSQLVLETDCPYLAPSPFRGKRNSSLYLSYIAGAVAEIKGVPAERVIEETWNNGKRLYRMNANE